MTIKIVRVKTAIRNGRAYRVGDSHQFARHSDEVVERAKAMRAAGLMYWQIEMFLGVNLVTVGSWCRGHRRNVKASRVISQRVSVDA
jgi:transposase-like protein